jgi:predicted transcriptional regulator
MTTGKTLQIDARTPTDGVLRVLKALSHETRLSILELVGDRVVPLSEIARDLNLPASTAAMHTLVLESAGLLHTEMRPASRGLQKVCSRTYDELVIDLPRGLPEPRNVIEHEMPVGGFSDAAVQPTCGMASATGLIGFLDDPSSFYEPGRLTAQLVWFGSGYVEYRFPNRLPPMAHPTMVQFSAEVCSEAPLNDPNWPSDITVWINDVDVGTWTSPGDFGGERGRYTPSWWESKDSQYGVLKRWRVSDAGTSVDGVALSDVRLADLELAGGAPIRVRIGVRPEAAHVGGINLFGRAFGNYQQDLVLLIEYQAGSSTYGVRRPAEPIHAEAEVVATVDVATVDVAR